MRENQKTTFIQYLPSSLAILSGTIENLLEPLESLLERCSPSPCLLRLLNSLPLSSPCFAFRRKTLEQGQRIKDFGQKRKPGQSPPLSMDRRHLLGSSPVLERRLLTRFFTVAFQSNLWHKFQLWSSVVTDHWSLWSS